MTENPLDFGEVVGDHQVITRAGQVEAVVVPSEEYRALKALEQREAELYWAIHEARYPSRPGDDVPEDEVYESMDCWPTSTSRNEVRPHRGLPTRPASAAS